MFDIGFWEILLILILALVIIGPERLPAAARQAGLFVGKARRYIEGVRSEVESELDVTEFKRMLHNQEVQINELQQQLKAGVDDVRADLPGNEVLSDLHGLNDDIIRDQLKNKPPQIDQTVSAEENIEDASNTTSSDTASPAKKEKV